MRLRDWKNISDEDQKCMVKNVLLIKQNDPWPKDFEHYILENLELFKEFVSRVEVLAMSQTKHIAARNIIEEMRAFSAACDTHPQYKITNDAAPGLARLTCYLFPRNCKNENGEWLFSFHRKKPDCEEERVAA